MDINIKNKLSGPGLFIQTWKVTSSTLKAGDIGNREKVSGPGPTNPDPN